MLANLLANARTHTPAGTTVTVGLGRSDGGARLTVVDDGPGIAPDLLPHVFERFARGSASRSRHDGSTGLGLAIVDAVVAAHGGTVAVHSRPGRTEFAVWLPDGGRVPGDRTGSRDRRPDSDRATRHTLACSAATGRLTGRAQPGHRTGTGIAANVVIVTTTVPTLPARPESAEPAPPGLARPPVAAPRARRAARGTAVLYLWGLSRSGWANAFYSAAAQAGGESWKAWFFGSSDAANSITVDKTPASLWMTGLSVRIFGLSSWSILVPQALMGVAAVGLLYAAVARSPGRPPG